MPQARAALRLSAGIAVSLACLYFATRGTDWGRVANVLGGARLGWVAAVVVAGAATVYIRAQRWCILLRPLGEVPLYPALSATAIGFGATAVLPFRLGELLRPALLGRRAGVGVSAALSSVVLERLLDMVLVIGAFLVLSFIYPLPRALNQGALGLGAIAAIGFAVLLLLRRQPGRTGALMRWLMERLPARLAGRVRPAADSFLSGLDGLSDGVTVAVVVAYSLYLWGVITLTYLFALLALGIQAPLVTASLASVVIVAAFVFLPQAPGFVGTWQAGCVLALGLFGVSKDVAVGYSLLTWAANMVVSIGGAGVFLAREDFSPGQLLRVAAREEA